MAKRRLCTPKLPDRCWYPPLNKIKNKNYEKQHGRNHAGRINVTKRFVSFCDGKKIEFELIDTINSYDNTTLFCIAGMQKYKSLFNDINYHGTITNSQSCLRLNDLEEINDGIHSLTFDMLGLFSFRELNVKQSIDFWMEFLFELGIKPDYVTIHPDKNEWKSYYDDYNIEVRLDSDCTWSDGSENSVMSYCTEFYKDDIEIGNIVNPYGDCIDCGFGKNRIEMILTGIRSNREDVLKETIFKIINSGFVPTYNKQGSILRKLLRICYLENIIIDHQFYRDEIIRQDKIINRYNLMKDKPKFKNKDRNFWMNTIGLDIDLIKGIL